MKCRLVRTRDIETVTALDRVIMGETRDAWPIDTDEHWLAKDIDGEPWGYCSVRPAQFDPDFVAFLSRAGVLLGARGMGLQRRMIQCRMRWAKRHGKLWAVTYAHASNAASLRNLIHEGFLPYRPGLNDADKEPGAADWAGWEAVYLRRHV